MGKEAKPIQPPFEEQLRDQLSPYFDRSLVDDWMDSIKRQIDLIHRDPDWWSKGEEDFKSFILELTSDIIFVQQSKHTVLGGDPHD